MGAGHQRETVGVVEGFRDVLSEGVAGTSGGDAPPTAVIWVGPQQVAHGALMDRKQLFYVSTQHKHHQEEKMELIYTHVQLLLIRSNTLLKSVTFFKVTDLSYR